MEEEIKQNNELKTGFTDSDEAPVKKNSFLKGLIMSMIMIIFLAFAVIAVIYIIPSIAEKVPAETADIKSDPDLRKEASYKKQLTQVNKDIQRLSKKYNSYTAGQAYIIINTTENTFELYRDQKLIRNGSCSSGSYTMLKSSDGKKKWVFKTPKGKYRILGKTKKPVWHKPDWAFVEEGLPIPANDDPSRYERGVLGDYALAIGDGYMIHGTIYKRFLGMPVTHGCVRLNDEDLEVIFNTLDIGSRVYIF
jgi:lipoprotein-anchoring transpeptidase ErfK/SrfK